MTVAWAQWCYTSGERAPSTLMAVPSASVRGNRAGLTAPLSLPAFNHQPVCRAVCVPGCCLGTGLEAIGLGRCGIQANVRPARPKVLASKSVLEVRPRGSLLDLFLTKISSSFFAGGALVCWGGDAALRHSTQESAMQRVFIIAIMFLGITAAQGQTVTQPNGHTNSSIGATNSSESAVGSDPVGVSTSSLSSGSSTSPSSQSGTVSGSPAATGSASGGARATSSGAGAAGSGSTSSQAPLLLPGEIPDTSTQAASTTATAPSSSSPICPPPVPSTDGGSVNLTEIAGASLGGC
jgi:hypothetical protein